MNHLLFQAVDRSAQARPDHDAVRYSGNGLSYAALARRSNGLARLLVAQGVRRGDRVGIFMNKSLDAAVAIYGIMKAGAAYVPLDPFAPAARVAFVIRNCGIRHLITTDMKLDLSELLNEDVSTLEWLVGSTPRQPFRTVSWSDVESEATDDPPVTSLTEQDLAYILYTSGSTGTPKGIMHTHRSGLSFAEWAADTYALTAADRVSNHAPLHFDLSTFDFFATAQAGATTVIVPEAITKLPADLGRLMAREKLSVWYSVPFALIQLLERGNLRGLDLSSLRWLLFAGEVFPTKHLRQLLEALPHVRFSNLFGPTETNVCTYYHVPKSLPASEEPIPIGRPCGNIEALIVDGNDRQVDEGEAGELLIRGGVVMRGYWGMPDRNQRAFHRRSIFDGHFDDVFYRTGDIVQMLPGGDLKYLGRKDRQIKTRGYRVELDEVETALLSLSSVHEAAAFTVPDGQGSHLIEAAVTVKGGFTLTPDAVMSHVGGVLPHYAVPTRVRVMDVFPRTSTGKIDRRSLEAQSADVSLATPR